MKVLFAVLVLALVGASLQDDWSYNVKGTMHGAEDIHNHHIPDVPILADGMTFDVTTTQDTCRLTLCWTYMINAPKVKEEWPYMCKDLWAWKPGQPLYTTKLVSPGISHINIYSSSNGDCDYEITMSGTPCPDNTYGDNCRALTPLPIENQQIQPSETIFFAGVVTDGLWASWLNTTVTETSGSDFWFYMREGDAPRWNGTVQISDAGSQYEGSGTIEIVNPRVTFAHWNPNSEDDGDYIYIFSVTNPSTTDAITVNVDMASDHCSHFKHGKSCKYLVPPLSTQVTYSVPNDAKEWWYGSILVSDPTDDNVNFFSLGITALEQQDAPAIYLRYGNVPDSDNFDMKLGWGTNTTRWYSSGRTDTKGALWFIGAHIAKSSQKGAFGVWFDSDCPNSCSLHGSCNSNHECDCDEGYTNDWFECSMVNKGSSGDSPDIPEMSSCSSPGMSGGYIFFIVMFCIETVVIIGMIAAAAYWFVIREKYMNYEQLD